MVTLLIAKRVSSNSKTPHKQCYLLMRRLHSNSLSIVLAGQEIQNEELRFGGIHRGRLM